MKTEICCMLAPKTVKKVQVTTYDRNTMLPVGYMMLDTEGEFYKKLMELKEKNGGQMPMLLHPG